MFSWIWLNESEFILNLKICFYFHYVSSDSGCEGRGRIWDANDVYKLFIGQLNISYWVVVWFTNKSKQSVVCCTFIFFLLSLNLDTHSKHVYLYFRPIEPGGVSGLPPVPLGTSKHINFVHSWWCADDKLRLLARVYVRFGFWMGVCVAVFCLHSCAPRVFIIVICCQPCSAEQIQQPQGRLKTEERARRAEKKEEKNVDVITDER